MNNKNLSGMMTTCRNKINSGHYTCEMYLRKGQRESVCVSVGAFVFKVCVSLHSLNPAASWGIDPLS